MTFYHCVEKSSKKIVASLWLAQPLSTSSMAHLESARLGQSSRPRNLKTRSTADPASQLAQGTHITPEERTWQQEGSFLF